MKQPESVTTPLIIKWLQDQGVMAWRMNSGTFRMGGRHIKGGDKGMPDIMGILPNGTALVIENKSNGASLTDEQAAWLARATRQKAHVIVALKGLESVVEYFETVINRGK